MKAIRNITIAHREMRAEEQMSLMKSLDLMALSRLSRDFVSWSEKLIGILTNEVLEVVVTDLWKHRNTIAV